MFRYFSQKHKCKLPAAHKEQSSVFTQQEKKNTVNMWYFWAKENTWACLKSTFQTGLFADHDSSPDQTTCCHCQTCTYSQAANSNQNCCSCLQGEIDTCRSASIRGYIIRGSSVSFKVWDMTVFEDGEVGAGLSQRHSYSKHTDHTVHGAVLPPDSTAPWKPTDKQRKLLQIIHEIHVFMIPFINQFCGQVIQ